jgi:hypothetical protein
MSPHPDTDPAPLGTEKSPFDPHLSPHGYQQASHLADRLKSEPHTTQIKVRNLFHLTIPQLTLRGQNPDIFRSSIGSTSYAVRMSAASKPSIPSPLHTTYQSKLSMDWPNGLVLGRYEANLPNTPSGPSISNLP